MIQGFLLGLSTGVACLAYCSPVLVPYLLGENKSPLQSVWLLGRFLAGRLIGYLVFAVFSWLLARLLGGIAVPRELCTGGGYLLLSGVLLWYGWFAQTTAPCAGKLLRSRPAQWLQGCPAWLPVVMGLLTGLNLCPPFLLAIAGAAAAPTLAHSLLFFSAFFCGTSLYFLPLPLVGFVPAGAPVKTVGRLAAVLMSGYYTYTGIIMLIGGLYAL